MASPWKQMSQNEQIARYYLAYGRWGPRSNSTSKDGPDINVTYFIFRVMFNVVMISALGVSYINWRKDKNYHDSDWIMVTLAVEKRKLFCSSLRNKTKHLFNVHRNATIFYWQWNHWFYINKFCKYEASNIYIFLDYFFISLTISSKHK